MQIFDKVSLLTTHFNRSHSLKKMLQAFLDLGCGFGTIIVSDDHSEYQHIDKIRQLKDHFNFELVLCGRNKGLGHNINKGQDQVSTPYTLYIQEDFMPRPGFRDALSNAVEYMERDTQLDLVRFFAYRNYPFLTSVGNGFSQMDFKLHYKGYDKFYLYSDHPHLRRTSFFDKFGRYAEGFNPEQTEYRMMMSFLQNHGKGLFYSAYNSLFDHNVFEESTMRRNNLRRSDHPVITFARNLYRHLKFNTDYLFGKYRH